MSIDEFTEQLPPALKLAYLLIHATHQASLAGLRGHYPDSAVEGMIGYLEQARGVCEDHPGLLPTYRSRACTIVRIAEAAVSTRNAYNRLDFERHRGQNALLNISHELLLRDDMINTSTAAKLLSGYRIR
ncbi:hypothetical protein HYU15_04455 [Candidatus Woesearchaeota archaeon]|nr:hypothetical protein [Candidatus Woesearchaeota archaeon]